MNLREIMPHFATETLGEGVDVSYVFSERRSNRLGLKPLTSWIILHTLYILTHTLPSLLFPSFYPSPSVYFKVSSCHPDRFELVVILLLQPPQ